VLRQEGPVHGEKGTGKWQRMERLVKRRDWVGEEKRRIKEYLKVVLRCCRT